MTALSCKTWKVCEHFLRFFGKTTPCCKIFKILFWKFSPPHRSTLFCWNVVFFPKVNRRNRALFTGPKTKTKILAHSQTVANVRIAPKIYQGQLPTFGSHFSRFRPNRFAFGGVIAERVKAVILHHRVFSWLTLALRAYNQWLMET